MAEGRTCELRRDLEGDRLERPDVDPDRFPPTNGRDGWADFDQTTGFERELLDILRFQQARGIGNSIWITTDVHFAEVFRYRPFADDPTFTVHELAGGSTPGIFPNVDFDTTLNPERLFFFEARVGGRRDDVDGGEAVVQLRTLTASADDRTLTAGS